MEYETILYEKSENVAWITLNRPEVLNAQSEELLSELTMAFDKAREDNEIWVIVLTGAGEKAFSAGADITMFLSWTPIDPVNKFKGIKRPYQQIREIPKPVVAMVNGFCLGGGCELAMACDIIIASENARFGQPEINVGVIPGGGGTQILPRLVGEKKAKELIFTGDMLSAQEALELGLVNKVVPKEKLRETVDSLLAKLKTKSPAILKLAKLSVNNSLDTPLSTGMAWEMDLFASCFAMEDQKEGTKAFLEKKIARYTGR